MVLLIAPQHFPVGGCGAISDLPSRALDLFICNFGSKRFATFVQSVHVLGAADRNDRFLQRMKTKVDLSVVEE